MKVFVRKMAPGMPAPKGVMVALSIPTTIAQMVCVPGGELPDDLHVTVCYIPKIGADEEKKALIVQAISPLAQSFAPLQGAIGGTGRFFASESSDGKDVFYASYNSPGLEKLRAAILAKLDDIGIDYAGKHGFTPHITLKYLEPGEPSPQVSPMSLPFAIDRMVIGGSSGLAELQFSGVVVLKSAFSLSPDDAYNGMIPEQGIVGGTIKDGSDDEKFLFGRMTFDVQKGRDMGGTTPNAEIEVSPKWIDKTKVDFDNAMNGVSTAPVFVAQIHTHEGIKPLLIDGNHRMYKAIRNGVAKIPAHVFSPEETVALMTTSRAGSEEDPAPSFVGKGQPGSSSVHVPSTEWAPLKKMVAKIAKALGIAKEDPDQVPPVNNLDQGSVRKDPEGSLVGGAATNATDGLYSMSQLIAGMDWELGDGGQKDEYQAKEIAITNLAKDPDYYRKKFLGESWTSDEVAKDTQEDEQDPMEGTGNIQRGLWIDAGSGHARIPGHIGLDTYPYDYGTAVHDLNLPLPFDDHSVSKFSLVNVMDHPDAPDPKAMLSEIQRVLMPGGQFVYQGPNEIQNYPQFLEETYREGGSDEGEQPVEKIEGVPGKPVRQEFTRLAVPDAATADDAEPRIGIAQFDMLPADALLAMDALGYYWSDATSSGRGNRASGYPSQGALVNRPTEKSAEVAGEERGHGSVDYDLAKAAMECDDEEDEDCDQMSFKLAAAAVAGPVGKAAVKKDELTAQGRKHVKTFALPGEKKYPIHDISHARNALARASGKPEEAKVKAAVYRKYPSLKPQESSAKIAKDARHAAKRAEAEQIAKTGRKCRIFKAAPMKQIVYGVILTPEEVDQQEDFMSADDIEKSAHAYLVKSRTVGSMHQKPIQAEVVESYIAPQDFKFEGGQYGPQVVKKGSWVMGVRVTDPKEWQKVMNGDYQAFSVGGFGSREAA